MRFLILAPTATPCLCPDCAREQLSWNHFSRAERDGHVWDLDQPALIVVDRGSEQPCTGCQQAPAPNETAEYLLLHIYRLIKFLGAYRDLTAYGGTMVDLVIDSAGKRFPAEAEAIKADIRRLVE